MKNNYFPTDYQEFIHLSRYARWLGNRRETWAETVERYFEFMQHTMKETYGHTIPNRKELEEAVHVCPLCVSQLEEAIDEERILEHLNVVVGLVDRLSQLDESEEDIETVIDETIQELLLQTDDDEE